MTNDLQNDDMGWHGQWLEWIVSRSHRLFRVYVVEPKDFKPQYPNEHEEIFTAAIQFFVPSPTFLATGLSATNTTPQKENFDLITFPEAFLPFDILLKVLPRTTDITNFGCVHVGLRPTNTGTHLFQPEALRKEVAKLEQIDTLEKSDLDKFKTWLNDQPFDSKFNIACLFTIDIQKKIRICLHPKIIQSKFEAHVLPELNMTEANLLTLVSLKSADPSFRPIVIQPLICSDALQSTTGKPNMRPIEAISSSTKCFREKGLPEHIDIVSVTTCTPQPEDSTNHQHYQKWHQEFRKSFIDSASNDKCNRHYSAIFILSNFNSITSDTETTQWRSGGLSGMFLPTSIPTSKYENLPFITTSSYGKFTDGDDLKWSEYYEIEKINPKKSRAHIVAIKPDLNGQDHALMLGLTIQRMIRDSNNWDKTDYLTNFTLHHAKKTEDNLFSFEKSIHG